MTMTLAETLVAVGMTPELAKTLADAGVLTDNAVVLAGAQTIAGVKTFSDIPVFPSGGITVGSTTITATEIGVIDTVAGSVIPKMPTAVQQAINADGAISLTAYNTAITSVGTTGQAFTLADSTLLGQRKRIQLIVDDGDATVTFNTNATIVFADVGDVAELIWNGADWIPIALFNCADGATAPVYTPAS